MTGIWSEKDPFLSISGIYLILMRLKEQKLCSAHTTANQTVYLRLKHLDDLENPAMPKKIDNRVVFWKNDYTLKSVRKSPTRGLSDVNYSVSIINNRYSINA